MELTSWLPSARDPDTDFPIKNLPYGIFDSGSGGRIGVAIGDRILDLHACASHGYSTHCRMWSRPRVRPNC